MNYKFYAAFLLFQMCLFAQTPVWTTFYNGPLNGHDQANGVFFDNNGNIYIAGEEFGAASGGNFSTVKINPTGNVVWSSAINGPHNGTDAAYGVCVDNVGNVYSTGTVQWSLNYYKIQTVKYSPSGSVIWKVVFDSSGNSDGDANAITLDADGNIFITGSQALANGDYDLLTIKMDSAGNVLNTSSIGQLTNQWDSGTHILTDNNGNVYVAGSSYRNNSVGREVVVIKYNNSLDTSWVAHINGSDNTLNEFAEGIALDDSGNVHVLCQLQNTNGGADFGIIKLNSSGSVVWRVDYNEVGQEPDNPASISIDNQGNVFVTGRVRRSITGTPFDIITIKYNNSGIQQWKSYYDGPNNEDDIPVSLSLDQSGNVFVCGASNRTGSYYKFIVVKYLPSGVFDWEYVYDADVNSLAIGIWADNNGFVYAAGDGGGPNNNRDYIALKLSKTTGVEETNLTVNNFSLSQNYPNPFNPSTKISWQSPVSGHQSLKVYDVLGNEMVKLVDEFREAGRYELTFDASDLPSGIYFYKLHTGNFVETNKMLLLK